MIVKLKNDDLIGHIKICNILYCTSCYASYEKATKDKIGIIRNRRKCECGKRLKLWYKVLRKKRHKRNKVNKKAGRSLKRLIKKKNKQSRKNYEREEKKWKNEK